MKKFNDYEIPLELSSRDAQLRPYSAYERLRDEAPVRYDAGRDVWDVFRYDDVNEVLTDPVRFSSEGTSHFGKHLLSADPPEHTALKAAISDYFTSSFIADLEPLIEERARQFLTEGVDDGGRTDFLWDVAIPYPISIIADLLEIPQERRQTYRRWSENLLRAPLDPDPTAIERSHQVREETSAEMTAFFEDIVAEREQNLGEDVVSTLIRAEESIDFFDRELTLNTCNILMVGGHITTSTFLSNSMLAFIRHGVLADVDSGAVSLESALEESLRYRSPVSRFDRITAEPTTVRGTEIPAGERVILWAASANRDERAFDDPDAFDPGRDSVRPHIAFGRGIHTCIGNHLARVEGRILFSTFLDLYDDARLATDSLEPFPSTMVNGVETLPIRVD